MLPVAFRPGHQCQKKMAESRTGKISHFALRGALREKGGDRERMKEVERKDEKRQIKDERGERKDEGERVG